MGEISRKFELSQKIGGKYRLVCRECSRETLHSIVCSYDESGNEDCGAGNYVDWYCKNQIIQCLGCETVSFRKVSKFSEDIEYDPSGPFSPETIQYYPGRSEGLRFVESFLLPNKIEDIYRETVFAIENEQHVLAGIGIRAIVETVCKDLNVKGKNLKDKIYFLRDRSIVTQEGAETLHKLRVLGNYAAHEVKAHDSRQLELAMKIIEHILDGTYIIPRKVQYVFPEKG